MSKTCLKNKSYVFKRLKDSFDTFNGSSAKNGIMSPLVRLEMIES